MNPKTKHQILALAGILQASELINELATHGHCNPRAFQASVETIYQLDPVSVEAVYSSLPEETYPKNLLLGLSTLEKLFSEERSTLKKNSLRYFFNLLHIERQWFKKAQLMHKLREKIQTIMASPDFTEDRFSSRVLADLADAYTSTMEVFDVRLIIRGNRHHLSQLDNLNRIRTLLLAGLRSAMLWRQVGGNKLQLLFGSRKLLKILQNLLA